MYRSKTPVAHISKTDVRTFCYNSAYSRATQATYLLFCRMFFDGMLEFFDLRLIDKDAIDARGDYDRLLTSSRCCMARRQRVRR